MIAGGGNLFNGEYLITVGVFALFTFSLIVWRIIHNCIVKTNCSRLKQSVQIISAFLLLIVFFTFFFMASAFEKTTNFRVIQVITLLLLVIQNFLPLIFFGIIFLVLHFWIGIYMDIFKISRGNIFTKYTRILFSIVSIPLIVLAILNVISLKRVFMFRTRQKIDLAVFLLPTIIALALSSFLLCYSIFLLYKLYDKKFKKRMLYLIFRFIFVSFSIFISCILNIANRYMFNFLLPFEFHLVFLLIICFEICFLIYFDFNFLHLRSIKNGLIVIYCRITGNEYFDAAIGSVGPNVGISSTQIGDSSGGNVNTEIFQKKRPTSCDNVSDGHNEKQLGEKKKSKFKLKFNNTPNPTPRSTVTLNQPVEIQMDPLQRTDSFENDLHALDILHFNKNNRQYTQTDNESEDGANTKKVIPINNYQQQQQQTPIATIIQPIIDEASFSAPNKQSYTNTCSVYNKEDDFTPSDTSNSDNSISINNSLPINYLNEIIEIDEESIVHNHLDDEL
ncbi:hypothetical protein RB653_008334 [Dictyostelium firmibasis]|uniref:Uncharacterized protein n=1 Tax=Dictyostelium firmibasis TaxID=79012 RepID=A0AAN7YTX7_9MYCE